MTLRTLCVVALAGLITIAVPCGPKAGHAETGNEQGARQLEFARTELEAGRFDRAIKSAESALRLDPSQYEAIVIKALAFEAIGEPGLAESLLVAYLEFTRGAEPDPRVGEALERLASTDKRKKPGARDEAAAPLSSQEHEEAMRALIGVGRCGEAFVPAMDRVKANPKDPRAHGALGDVYRCAARLRPAGLAYRQAVALGSQNQALLTHLKAIEERLASLAIDLEVPVVAGIDVLVRVGTLTLKPTSFSRKTARFDLMDTDADLVVTIGGRGFVSQTLAVPALQRGELRKVKLAVSYVGVGTVSVTDWPPGGIDRVEIMDGREAVLAYPGQSLSLEAGTTHARVTNRLGTMLVPLQIVNSQETRFEPGRWMPAEAVVSGLPTGSKVEIELGERSEEWISIDVPRGDGVVDEATGALLAPPQRVTGLVAGQTSLRVSHATLGVGAQAITLVAAESTAVVFDQSQLPETSALTKRWREHKIKVGQGPFNVPAFGAAVGGGVVLGLGLGFLGASADSKSKEDAKYDLYFAESEAGGNAGALGEEWQAQKRTTQGLRAAGGIFTGIGAVGVGVSIPIKLLFKPKPKAGATGPVWEPEGF